MSLLKPNNLIFSLVLATSLVFIHCSKETNENTLPVSNSGNVDNTNIDLEGNLQVSDFVWRGLNEFYYWQDKGEDVSDEKLTDATADDS